MCVLHEEVDPGVVCKCFAGNARQELLGHAASINAGLRCVELIHKGDLQRLLQPFTKLIQLLESITENVLPADLRMVSGQGMVAVGVASTNH